MEPRIEIEEIGPERAAELLGNNDRNRRVDWRAVELYSRQMTEGTWRFAGDPIRVSVTGRLLDGQYRLNAVILSKTTQRFTVIYNLPDEVQPYMDVGKRRSPGDVFSMYEVPAPGPTAALTQLLMRYERGVVLEAKYSITAAEALAYYQDPENTHLINEGTKRGLSVKRILPLNPSVAGVVFVVASRQSDPFAVNEFFERLTSGLGLQQGDPIAALRNWLIRRHREDLRVNRAEYLYLLVRVWNAWVLGEEMARVQLPKGGLSSKDKLPGMLPAGRRDPEPCSEDNPAATPYSLTRKEREAKRKAG